MITDAMVAAAWQTMSARTRALLDQDDVRRILAAGLAECRWDEVRVISQVLQRPDAEGDW